MNEHLRCMGASAKTTQKSIDALACDIRYWRVFRIAGQRLTDTLALSGRESGSASGKIFRSGLRHNGSSAFDLRPTWWRA
jgi:hypothetical protein